MDLPTAVPVSYVMCKDEKCCFGRVASRMPFGNLGKLSLKHSSEGLTIQASHFAHLCRVRFSLGSGTRAPHTPRGHAPRSPPDRACHNDAGFAFFGLILGGDIFAPGIARLGLTPLFAAVLVGAAQNVFSKSAKYSLFDPCKEMAYIPLDKETQVRPPTQKTPPEAWRLQDLNPEPWAWNQLSSSRSALSLLTPNLYLHCLWLALVAAGGIQSAPLFAMRRASCSAVHESLPTLAYGARNSLLSKAWGTLCLLHVLTLRFSGAADQGQGCN